MNYKALLVSIGSNGRMSTSKEYLQSFYIKKYLFCCSYNSYMYHGSQNMNFVTVENFNTVYVCCYHLKNVWLHLHSRSNRHVRLLHLRRNPRFEFSHSVFLLRAPRFSRLCHEWPIRVFTFFVIKIQAASNFTAQHTHRAEKGNLSS